MEENKIVIGWVRLSEEEKQNNGANYASVTGHVLLERLMEQEYGIVLSDEEEPVKAEVGGKPYLNRHRELHFNISHSGAYVICAVGKTPLGIDIQYQKKGDHRRTGKRIMTPEEWKQYEVTGFHEEVFFQCWTKKESYLKYTGEGIRRDMRMLTYDNCRFYELQQWPEYSAVLCVSETWNGKIEICPCSF